PPAIVDRALALHQEPEAVAGKLERHPHVPVSTSQKEVQRRGNEERLTERNLRAPDCGTAAGVDLLGQFYGGSGRDSGHVASPTGCSPSDGEQVARADPTANNAYVKKLHKGALPRATLAHTIFQQQTRKTAPSPQGRLSCNIAA